MIVAPSTLIPLRSNTCSCSGRVCAKSRLVFTLSWVKNRPSTLIHKCASYIRSVVLIGLPTNMPQAGNQRKSYQRKPGWTYEQLWKTSELRGFHRVEKNREAKKKEQNIYWKLHQRRPQSTAALAMAVAVAAACGTRYALGSLRGLKVHSFTGLLFCSSFPHWTVPLYVPFPWRFLLTSLFLNASFPHFFLSWLFLDGSYPAGLFLYMRLLPVLTWLSSPCTTLLWGTTTPHSACRDGYTATSQSACIPPAVRNTTHPWAKTAQSTPRPQLINRNPSLRRYATHSAINAIKVSKWHQSNSSAKTDLVAVRIRPIPQ